MAANAITQRFLNFLDSGDESDILLIVGPNQVQIKAHKQVLMLSSPYFCSKLTGRIKRTASSSTSVKLGSGNQLYPHISLSMSLDKELNITEPEDKAPRDRSGSLFRIEDVEEHEVRLFLKYLYSRTFPDSYEDALPLFHAAIKFEEAELLTECRKVIERSLSCDNILPIFEFALGLEEIHLASKCLQLVCSHAHKIVEQQAFTELRGMSLTMILEQNDLKVTDEMQLFQALIRWGKQECNRQNLNSGNSVELRSVLDPYISLIRFPQMNATEFSMHVATQNVLSSDELVSILLYFNVPESQRSIMPAGRFNPNPRVYKGNSVPSTFTSNDSNPSVTRRPLIQNSVQWRHLSVGQPSGQSSQSGGSQNFRDANLLRRIILQKAKK